MPGDSAATLTCFSKHVTVYSSECSGPAIRGDPESRRVEPACCSKAACASFVEDPDSCISPMAADGRPTPAAAVSCLAPPRRRQLCGHDIARPAVAGRPKAEVAGSKRQPWNPTFEDRPQPGWELQSIAGQGGVWLLQLLHDQVQQRSLKDHARSAHRGCAHVSGPGASRPRSAAPTDRRPRPGSSRPAL